MIFLDSIILGVKMLYYNARSYKIIIKVKQNKTIRIKHFNYKFVKSKLIKNITNDEIRSFFV